MATRKGSITINGKDYSFELHSGKTWINGMSVEEFSKFLEENDPEGFMDMAVVGRQAVIDEIRGTKPRKYASIAKTEFLKRNN